MKRKKTLFISCCLAVVATSPSVGSTGDRFLECDFEGRKLILGYNEQAARIYDARLSNVAFSDIDLTPTMFVFSVQNQRYVRGFFDEKYAVFKGKKPFSMEGVIQRVTGDASLWFFEELTSEKIDQCNQKNRGPWCNYPVTIGSRDGICKPIQRRF